MFADASWPAHGVFLGRLSLSAFVFVAWPVDVPWQYRTWLDNMCTYMYAIHAHSTS